MKTFSIDVGNSPKFYAYLTDIYGAALDLSASDFLALEYSVYKVTGASRTPVSGFSNVAINAASNWFSTPQQYPPGIVGLTAEEASRGYNLTFFPYVATVSGGVASWTSPFSQASSVYEVDLRAAYFMQDAALQGGSRFERTETIRVVTRAQ